MDYKFECQRCLYCCSAEPGYVFLSEKEINDISNYIGLSFDEFISIYARKVDYGHYYMISLKEKENYDCIFLKKDGCSIYPVRPVQCRTYPFWRGIADNDDEWNKESKSCPGIGKGRKYSKKEIKEEIEKNGINPPYMILK